MKIHSCTQQWCEASRDGVGNTERQQQETNDGSSQPPHDEVKVDVSDAVSVHLQEGGSDAYWIPRFAQFSLSLKEKKKFLQYFDV